MAWPQSEEGPRHREGLPGEPVSFMGNRGR